MDPIKVGAGVLVWKDGQLLLPEKCLEWKWFSPDALPQPLFEPVVSLLKEVALQAPSL